MCRAREAMATTSFVGVVEIEKGLWGSGIMEGTEGLVVVVLGRWMCRVESQEALIRRAFSLL